VSDDIASSGEHPIAIEPVSPKDADAMLGNARSSCRRK
jgi:hypothetical protein